MSTRFRLGSLLLLSGALLPLAAEPPVERPERVVLGSGKDKGQALLYRPSGKGPFPAVLVLHGDFGLTGWVQKQARRLADKGYLVLAVDLYRGLVAKDIEEAHILDRGLPENRVLADLKAAVDYLAARPDVRKGGVGAIGWDMGGGYSLDAAIHDRRIAAVVVCYGRLTTDAAVLRKMHASVLGIFGAEDEGIPADIRTSFQKAMKRAGKRIAGLHVYPGCNTGFMDRSSPYLTGRPNERAIADAWNRIESYFQSELKR